MGEKCVKGILYKMVCIYIFINYYIVKRPCAPLSTDENPLQMGVFHFLEIMWSKIYVHIRSHIVEDLYFVSSVLLTLWNENEVKF